MGVAEGLISLEVDYYHKISKAYMDKRDRICDALSEAGLNPYIPQGAYYVLADISSLPGENSKDRAMNLLHNTGVACVPGTAFYHDSSGESLARFCFAKENSILDQACKRISKLKK
jgi:aminotransferase